MTTSHTRVGFIALALALAAGATVTAEPQHGSGGHARPGRVAVARNSADVRNGHFDGGRVIVRPEFRTHVLSAGPRFHAVRRFDGHFYVGGIYDPYWWPYAYPTGLFPFSYYPYGPFAYTQPLGSDVKVKVTPKDTQVFVDGYYAGVADNFDGTFQQLNVTPGGHEITLYRNGYRTLDRSIYAAPGATVTFKDDMVPLQPGQVSEPPAPPQVPVVAPVAR